MLKFEQSFLAFDFGEARIGVAQGHRELALAHPLTTITGKNNQEKIIQIEKLIKEWQPDALIVGLPTHADGTVHEITALAKKFGEKLHQRFQLPIYWVDERFTSLYADELLKEAGVFGQKRKQVSDQIAAQAILYSFFDQGAVETLPKNKE